MVKILDIIKLHKMKIGIGVIILAVLVLYFQFNRYQSVNQLNAVEKKTVMTSGTKIKNKEEIKAAPSKAIKVDVKGAVIFTGVYSAREGQRVEEIVQLAKPRKNADLDAVNLSMQLKDQMVIYIPYQGEVKGEKFEMYHSIGNTSGNDSGNTVNINQASESELQNIPGIGPKKAADIIKYREEHDGFKTKEEMKEIRGIGDKTFISIEPYIEL